MPYAYLIWSLILLGIWGAIFAIRSRLRGKMLRMSLITAPLGLSEPLFVPDYWLPPTLFDLAERTGFDLESLIFAFAVGGISSSIYPALVPVTMTPVASEERHHSRHRWHKVVLWTPIVLFLFLETLTPWNPIYTASLAMFSGGIANGLCRPDLWRPMLVGSFIFTAVYFAYFSSLVAFYPAYVDHVWQLASLSGWLVAGVPVEELLFAGTLGLMWCSLYEHLYWRRYLPRPSL